MISSTTQRLPWKTCGLFDSSYAGDDVQFVTGPGPNAAPTDALSDFGFEGQGLNLNLNPGVSGMKSAVVENFDNTTSKLNNDVSNSWIDDLEGLSGDPLGDDSMEAFINLDKFLNGNSFFDEDGNLTVPNDEQEVTPVINFTPQAENTIAVAENTIQEINGPDYLLTPPVTKTTGKPSRKRSASAVRKSGIKTSLYEIPAATVIPNIIQETSIDQLTNTDTVLDHDYSSKRQRLSDPNEDIPSTSGATTNSTQPDGIAVLANDDNLDKQTIRRIKNNYASKRSREQRKQKFVDMDVEAEELVVKNQQLREKIVELEKIAKEMKAVLVAKMAGKAI